MESLLDWSAYVTPLLSTLALDDAQLTRCGRWLLAAAAAVYASTALHNPVTSDTRHAITAYLPQGYDRSIVDARLQQRRSKELLHRSLQLLPRRDALRTTRDRDAKLRGWEEVFRLTLAGMAAAAYTHSVTMLLFTMKNTVRVLVFVLEQREEAARARRAGGQQQQQQHGAGSAAPRTGAFARVRTWWSQGSRAMLTDVLLQQMLRNTTRAAASPFAHTGLGEEVPLPPVPATAATTTTTTTTAATATAATNDDNNEDDVQQRAAEAAATLAAAECAFCVKTVLDVVVPRIVACARDVVDAAVASFAPGTFSAAGVVHEEQLRSLLARMAAHMRTAMDKELLSMLYDATSASVAAAASSSSTQSRTQRRRRRAQRRTGAAAADGDDAAAAAGAAKQQQTSADAPPQHDDVDDDDVDSDSDAREDVDYEFPAGSTVLQHDDDEDGGGVHHHRGGGAAHASSSSRRRRAVDEFDDVFGPPRHRHDDDNDADDMGTGPHGRALTADEVAARAEAVRRDCAHKLHTASFFQTVLHSRSLVELCVGYGDETLQSALRHAAQLSSVRSYDAATQSAKMLLYITALDAHRQRLFDAEFAVPPYVQLFCEEMVRSTCA